ncbi:hypothetical protein [Rhizobium sp. Root1220]|uniref:hypothetical protein n=1 Tax=Rhizobium sp. Root1220 TaxID=1736432 RepID=UPI0009E85082|nr:hypothetical protein [Rhizobium sp. Root1220]
MFAGYFAVSSIFLLVTLLEGWANRDGWTLYRAAGVISVSVWPLMLVFFMFHARLWWRFSGSAHPVLCHYRMANGVSPPKKA